ncbi:hypothetical protein ATANTOWER_001295, partial [Ataeniobius toweri]|nr:hypothetical protein [Ataeniobius toweri]
IVVPVRAQTPTPLYSVSSCTGTLEKIPGKLFCKSTHYFSDHSPDFSRSEPFAAYCTLTCLFVLQCSPLRRCLFWKKEQHRLHYPYTVYCQQQNSDSMDLLTSSWTLSFIDTSRSFPET